MKYKILKDKILFIQDDTSPIDPRDRGYNESIFSKFFTRHKRYTFGDIKSEDGDIEVPSEIIERNTCWEDVLHEYIAAYYHDDENLDEWIEENMVYLPIYMYEHGDITISTTPFSCRWDSGQIGYIFAIKEDYERITGNKWDKEKVKACLEAEVAEYDRYIQGPHYVLAIDDIIMDQNGNIVKDPDNYKLMWCCGYTDYDDIIKFIKEKAGDEYAEEFKKDTKLLPIYAESY